MKTPRTARRIGVALAAAAAIVAVGIGGAAVVQAAEGPGAPAPSLPVTQTTPPIANPDDTDWG